jgi:aarF domain-containing kinase
MKKTSKAPSGLFSRSMSLLSMATKLAAREVGEKLSQSNQAQKMAAKVDQARIVVDHLSHLKGAAMKAGQMLSLDTSDFLPPEAIQILSKLQAQAQPVEGKSLFKVLRSELGEVRFAEIQSFSDTPLASASIGQVHTAKIKGKKVAIKIQYPGVAESIDSDLAILRGVSQTFLAFSGKKIDLAETFAEVKEVLKKETDYLNEVQNLKDYTSVIAGQNGYALPKPLDEYCTHRVLTMTFEEGTPLRDWMVQNPSLEKRTKIAELVLDLYCQEFAENGFVQTDPNFGNFLVRDKGSSPNDLQLVLLDFGATLRYSPEYRKGYAQLLKDLASNDTETIFQSAVRFGLLDSREPENVRQAFKTMIQVSLEPFSASLQPFKFIDPEYEKRTREANIEFSRSLTYSPPPRQLLFLHRKLAGVFSLVKRLGVELDLRPYWARMTRT